MALTRLSSDFGLITAARARGERGVRLNTTCREGERLTIEYETKRTGREPKWISVESNMDGYDVLSVISPMDKQLLSIEVTASKSGLKEYFHLTPNEWMLALKTNRHLFHLWDRSDYRSISGYSFQERC